MTGPALGKDAGGPSQPNVRSRETAAQVDDHTPTIASPAEPHGVRGAASDGLRADNATGKRIDPATGKRIDPDARRRALAERQGELLQALLAGGAPPPGFTAADLHVQSKALRAKRRRVVASLRPDVYTTLGDRFVALFDDYADRFPRADDQRARDDAAAFAGWLVARGDLPAPRKPRWWNRFRR